MERACSDSLEWDQLAAGPPAPLWAAINKAVQAAGSEYYCTKRKVFTQPADPTMAAERLADARAQLTSFSMYRIDANSFVHQDIREMLYRWAAVVRKWRCQKLLNQLGTWDRETYNDELIDEFNYL